MTGFRKALLGAVFIATAASLGGCESMDSAMRGVSESFSSISMPTIRSQTGKSYAGRNEAPSQNAPSPSRPKANRTEISGDKSAAPAEGGENCPPITIVDELDSLHQFENPEKPTPETRISSVTLSGMNALCSYSHNNIVVSMDLEFTGEIGPRARLWNTDRPTFAYPYFMAITTQDGAITAKEVFAATISYEKGQDQKTTRESLRQIIPASVDSDPSYSILLGFQLTAGELAYNRSLKNIVVPAETAPVAAIAAEPAKEQPADAKKAVSKPLLITPPHKPQSPVKEEEAAATAPQQETMPVEAAQPAEPAPTPDAAAVESAPAAEQSPTEQEAAPPAATAPAEVPVDVPAEVAPETVETPALPTEPPSAAAGAPDEAGDEDNAFKDVTAE